MIDSNNINVMREKLRKVGGGSGDVHEEIERIDNLIGASPIPGAQRTITGSLNYLYDNISGGTMYRIETLVNADFNTSIKISKYVDGELEDSQTIYATNPDYTDDNISLSYGNSKWSIELLTKFINHDVNDTISWSYTAWMYLEIKK